MRFSHFERGKKHERSRRQSGASRSRSEGNAVSWRGKAVAWRTTTRGSVVEAGVDADAEEAGLSAVLLVDTTGLWVRLVVRRKRGGVGKGLSSSVAVITSGSFLTQFLHCWAIVLSFA